jgi:acetyl esterase/lipase
MKNILLTLLSTFLFANLLNAQQVINLYNGKAPGSENWTWHEKEYTNSYHNRTVYNVADPTITAYVPSNPNGTAVIVAPGGGFHTLSIDFEGELVAKWLNEHGITAFILKYRLVKSETDDPVTELMAVLNGKKHVNFDSINAPIISLAMHDGLTAVKYVRDHAASFKIDPAKIGFMGFSAGGTITMCVAYNATDADRPNFVAPIYAYEKAIIGSEVPKAHMPIFIAAASDDNLGLATHSVSIYLKWLAAKQPAELHMYEHGGHGFGMLKKNIPTDTWTDRFTDWLKQEGYL